MRNDRILRIYTDGGCAGNQSDENLGGWGAIMEFGGAQKELYGSERNTTNNRMEMTALLEAFKAIKKDGQMIQVFSDSSYLTVSYTHLELRKVRAGLSCGGCR